MNFLEDTGDVGNVRSYVLLCIVAHRNKNSVPFEVENIFSS